MEKFFVHSTILIWIIRTIHDVSLRFMSFLKTSYEPCACSSLANDRQTTKNTTSEHHQLKGEKKVISREDLETVLQRMSLRSSVHEAEKLEHMSYNALSSLFEEDEPSLQELKESFCVFDENNDGFIDENELQRVLGKLGFAEKVEVDACREMIRGYDRNQDGRIDFMDFVKLMEISFS